MVLMPLQPYNRVPSDSSAFLSSIYNWHFTFGLIAICRFNIRS